MKIFISHRSTDNYIVEKIMEIFERYNIKYWVDLKQIEKPDNIIRKINEGLENSTHFILIWSENAKSLEWVKKEIEAVTSYDYQYIKKFSFKLDNTKLPPLDFAASTFDKIDIGNVEEKTKEFIYSIGGSFETQIQSYKEKIIKAFKNYPPIKKLKDYDPIVKGFIKFNVHKEYVSQSFIIKNDKENKKRNDILKYILDLLKDESKKFIQIAGNYGSA